jgi:hypothetical protein
MSTFQKFRTFGDDIPKAGLIRRKPKMFGMITNNRMDRFIYRNFEALGIVRTPSWPTCSVSAHGPVSTRNSSHVLLRLLTRTTIVQRYSPDRWSSADAMIKDIQRLAVWSARLPFPVFKQLFCRLLEAQQRWNRNKRNPLDRNHHCRLAKNIRRFRKQFDIYPADDDTENDNNSFYLDDIKWLNEADTQRAIAEWEAADAAKRQQVMDEAAKNREELRQILLRGNVDVASLGLSLDVLSLDNGTSMGAALMEAALAAPMNVVGDQDENYEEETAEAEDDDKDDEDNEDGSEDEVDTQIAREFADKMDLD